MYNFVINIKFFQIKIELFCPAIYYFINSKFIHSFTETLSVRFGFSRQKPNEKIRGAVVKLSDSRLVGTEIKSQSRHGIFNLSIGSNPEWVLRKAQWVGVYHLHRPVFHNWFNKGRGMCYSVCGIVHIKDPLLFIEKQRVSCLLLTLTSVLDRQHRNLSCVPRTACLNLNWI